MVVDFLSRLTLLAENEEMIDDQLPTKHLFSISLIYSWFDDITNFLVAKKFPPNLSSKEKRKIVRKSAPYTWIWGNIFRLEPNHIFMRCVREDEVFDILSTCHDGPCGGHFSAKGQPSKFSKHDTIGLP